MLQDSVSEPMPVMKKRRFALPPLIWLNTTVLWLELLLRITCGLPVLHDGLPGALLTAVSFASGAALLCRLPRTRRVSRNLCTLLMELFTVWFTVAYFMDNSYSVFMTPSIIVKEAGNVAKNFGGNVLNVLTYGLPLILLYHIPVILSLVFHRRIRIWKKRRRLELLVSAILVIACFLGAWGLNNRNNTLKTEYRIRYTYDNAVRNFGLMSALHQELKHSLFPEKTAYSFTPLPESIPSPVESVYTSDIIEPDYDSLTTETVNYGLNRMDLDFTQASSSPQVAAVTEYIQSRAATSKNQYTGIFEGKNLILITAEAFSKEVIDPERTPALYRLSTQGIVFEDFYQPSWGGSTSTGEYSWLMGLAPASSTTMLESDGKNLYFTMGNQLQRLGYFSRAYHNGSWDYYSRYLTHPNLGYEEFIAVGTGMENGLSGGRFPESDQEMIDYTLPQYISHEPFSVYYMTISGHASYAFLDEINDMSVKNRDAVDDLPYSDIVKAYLAANMELEYAMESLLQQLEDAGIADNTVIAMVADHYPYGLSPSTAWGTSSDYLAELYGFKADTPWSRDHNAAIIWCGSLEKLSEPITVSGPVSSIDLLPTLSNLFGCEFDSRLMAGHDVFSDTEPLVFWNDYSWLTEKGTYLASEDLFTPADGEQVDEDYIQLINTDVRNKIALSLAVSEYDYYRFLFGSPS